MVRPGLCDHPRFAFGSRLVQNRTYVSHNKEIKSVVSDVSLELLCCVVK